MSRQFRKLIDIPADAPDTIRRKKLLEIMLIAVLIGSGLFLIIATISPVLGINSFDDVSMLLLFSIIGLCLALGIYVVNEYISSDLASVLFIVLLLFLSIFSDTPFEVSHGRSLLQFTLPIVVASLLLRPWAGFIVAEISGVIVSIISYQIGLPLPNIPGIVVFNVIALVVWLSTHSLEVTRNALEDVNANLENLVHQRTGDLHNAQTQLLRNERLAALGQVIGGIGHDLRNPLSSIRSAAFLLRMLIDEKEGERIEAIEIIENDVAVSEAILSGLFDFAKPIEAAKEPLYVKSVLSEVLNRIDIPSTIRLETHISEKYTALIGDSIQLKQVFSHIIRNAIHAMNETGGILKIGSALESEAWYVITISDTGRGIPIDNLEHIFEPLFTTKPQGIGLGLSIAKNIVEAHGGSIVVESEVGNGSSFYIRLPVSSDDLEVQIDV